MDSLLNLKIERPNERLIIVSKEGNEITNTLIFVHGMGDSADNMLQHV